MLRQTMKKIEVDDDVYAFIAGQTQSIGESASQILRRLLLPDTVQSSVQSLPEEPAQTPPNTDKTSVIERLHAQDIQGMSKKVDQFLSILSILYLSNPSAFGKVETIRGKGRIYFAQSKVQLTDSGKSTNPKRIPESDFWVVTNNNSDKKGRIIEQAMDVLGFSDNEIEQVAQAFKGK